MERIFITATKGDAGHQAVGGRRGKWNMNIDLYATDNFFSTPTVVLLNGGNTLIKTDSYMFVTKADAGLSK